MVQDTICTVLHCHKQGYEPLDLYLCNMLLWICLCVCAGFKLGARQRSGRDQEDGERHDPRREHEGRPRQVQDPETDPVRKHQTAHRRVRVHVMRPRTGGPSSWGRGLSGLLSCFTPCCFLCSPNESAQQHIVAATSNGTVYRTGKFKFFLFWN